MDASERSTSDSNPRFNRKNRLIWETYEKLAISAGISGSHPDTRYLVYAPFRAEAFGPEGKQRRKH